MNETKLMRADEIAHGFNGVAERKYWRATVAGTRVNPEVHFNSRSSMVVITYRISSGDFTVSFSRASAAFGDFLASVWRSLDQVLVALKAAGLPFAAPLDGLGTLRVEYDPRSKQTLVSAGWSGGAWPVAEPIPFKVPERNNSENVLAAIDNGYTPQ